MVTLQVSSNRYWCTETVVWRNIITTEQPNSISSAPLLYYICVREYLDHTFPGRWIGWRGGIEWSARSNATRRFLTGHPKTKLYAIKIDNTTYVSTLVFCVNQYIMPYYYSEHIQSGIALFWRIVVNCNW